MIYFFKMSSNYDPKIIIGNCLEVMNDIDEKSIDLIVTSPPYWGQRDYKASEQWGNESEVKYYLEKMSKWADECKRVLKDSGSLFLNIGDKYSKKSLMMIPERVALNFITNGWCLRNTIIWNKPNHMPSSVKDRFCNTYEYVYFFVKDSGKYYNYPYHSDIDSLRLKPKTTQKKLPFPDSMSIQDYPKWKGKIEKYNNDKKYTGKFKNETINNGQSPGARQSKGVHYSLVRKTTVNKSNSLEINQLIQDYFKRSKLTLKDIDAEFGYKDTASHWVRTDPGRSIPKPGDWFKLKDLLCIDVDAYDEKMTQQHYVIQNVKNNPKGKNPGDLWEIPTEKLTDSHYAVYPTELPRRIITCFCPEDGVVLDPFAGSGTTAVVSKELKRHSIMIDCNPEFQKIIEKRVQK